MIQMAGHGSSYALLFGLALATAVVIRWYTTLTTSDNRESPTVSPKFPLIEHLLSITTLQADYNQK